MIDKFIEKYFDRDFSTEKKTYYLVSFSAIVMFAFSLICVILMNFGIVPIVCVTIGMVLLIAIIYFAGLTERFAVCSILELFLFNILIIPSIYLLYGHFISGINLYFVIGVLFCTVLLDGIKMWIALVFSMFSSVFCMVFGYLHFSDSTVIVTDISRIYAEDCLALILCGIVAGVCLKCKMIFYSQERTKAETKKNEAEKMNESKNVFFSNVSHEIRTPMNAILGASQLLLDSDISESSKENVLNVLNACNALISYVGDILDFSRIDSEGVTLQENEDSLSEMLEDIINMISIRILNRGVDFYVDINPNVPGRFIFDSKLLRKLYVTLINNSIKNTKDGYILLSLSMEKDEAGRDILVSCVKDTGARASDKDINAVFAQGSEDINLLHADEYSDETVWSLSVCKAIVKAMNGSIVCSESGENIGTEIVLKIPVKIVREKADTEIMPVDREGFRVLAFEKDDNSEKMLIRALEQYGIFYDTVCGVAEFREQFMNNSYTHIFVDSKNYMELKDYIDRSIKHEKLVVIANVNQTGISGHPGSMLLRPIYYNNIKAIFENKSHSSLRKISIKDSFKCPGVKVMAVDDNATNLMVIESILNRYDMEVYTAPGGQECIYMLENLEVDIIFMDYMMPGMDGIDTLKNIRALDKEWAKNVPVITLTANAVAGVKEMLINEGFDEYLSKPIEISKLEKCLCRFLPSDKIVLSRED